MVDSGIGRTDLSELGERWTEAGPLPEPQDGDMRQPAPRLGLVDVQALQPLEEALGARGSPLSRAFNTESHERLQLVLFMTDGAATIGERDPAGW